MATNQILNSSLTADTEEILRQLRDAVESASLPANSWAEMHADEVRKNIGMLLIPLMKLTDELKHRERAEAGLMEWEK